MKEYGMKVYLDNCCFNRPFDDQSYVSIYIETEAKLEIQNLIKTGKLELVWSTVLDYENSMNPHSKAKEAIEKWRYFARERLHTSAEVIERGHELESIGFSAMDALHIACCNQVKADYFITVDKGILKKRNRFEGTNIVTPIEFIFIWENHG
jgi:predicted nucleic acid-binding protein